MVERLGRIFGGRAVVSALAVITSVNPVQAVLHLVRVFCQVAALRLLREVEFRALLLLVVYVGAIAVLFLFVVRRLNVQPRRRVPGEQRRTLPRAGVVGRLVLGERYRVYAPWVPGRGARYTGEAAPRVWVEVRDGLTNLESLGQRLYTHRFIYFILASVVLLVARVGAIVLTVQRAVGDQVTARRQQLHEQLSRDRERAVVRYVGGNVGRGSELLCCREGRGVKSGRLPL